MKALVLGAPGVRFRARALCVLLLAAACSTRAVAQGTAEARSEAAAPAAPALDGSLSALEERARRHYARALELHDAGAHAAALREFQSAHALVNDSRLLFNIAQLELTLEQHASAKRSLERYLHEAGGSITSQRRADVVEQLAALAEQGGERESAPLPAPGRHQNPAPEGARATAAASTPGLPPLASAAWASSGVLGLGALSTAVGTVLASRRHAELRRTRTAPEEAPRARVRLDRQRELVRHLSLATDVLALAAIGTAGLGLYFTLSSGSSEPRVSVEVGAGRVQLAGSF